MEEISQENLDKTIREPNIKKLRDEFNKKSFNSENHPQTSHKYKNKMGHSSFDFNLNKKYSRPNKTLSASKFNNQKYANIYKYNNKEFLDFYRQHPGYLYYKEILSNMKSRQFITNKKKTFLGKEINTKLKFGKTSYNTNNNKSNKNKISIKDKFPKIDKNKNKTNKNYIRNYLYNVKYGGNNKHIHNYNFNINNININIKDKRNPYSIDWLSRILRQNDYTLEIKEISNGIPKLIPLNKKDDFIHKIYNNNKLHINNYINDEKTKKEKEKEKEKENNKDKDKNKENKIDNEDLDEEQQMQFYKNQKNFFKVRKDIQEEPEDLEDDKDETKEKNKNKVE